MKRQLIVSVHDVTPYYTRELPVIFDALDRLGVSARTELVVPNFEQRLPIDDDPEFIALMLAEKAKGVELGLHGLAHRYAEFYRLNYTGAVAALDEGMKRFNDAFGFAPEGFVAPQWVQSRGSLRAVEERGFVYTEVLRSFRIFKGARFRGVPLNYDWGLVWLDRIITRRNDTYCRKVDYGLIRLAIHPMDVRNGVFDAACEHIKILIDKGFEPLTNIAFCKETVCEA